MNEIKQLDNATTRELEKTTVHSMNVCNKIRFSDRKFEKRELVFRAGVFGPAGVTTWYASWGIDPNKFKAKRDKLAELLGMKPNYHVDYEYKTAVWGLEIAGQKLVLYTSIKGTSIQLEEKTTVKRDLHAVYEALLDVMLNWEYIEGEDEEGTGLRGYLSYDSWR